MDTTRRSPSVSPLDWGAWIAVAAVVLGAGTAQAASIRVPERIEYASSSSVRDAIQNECALQTMIPQAIARSASNVELVPGKKRDLELAARIFLLEEEAHCRGHLPEYFEAAIGLGRSSGGTALDSDQAGVSLEVIVGQHAARFPRAADANRLREKLLEFLHGALRAIFLREGEEPVDNGDRQERHAKQRHALAGLQPLGHEAQGGGDVEQQAEEVEKVPRE